MTEPLRIAHLMRTASRSNAGIFMAARGLVRAEVARGDLKVGVFAATDEFVDADREQWDEATVRTLPARPPAAFNYTPGLLDAAAAFNPEIVHLHGLWLHNSFVARSLARRNGAKVVTSLHGMVSSWALRHHRFRKKITFALYERANLQATGCLHALSPVERDDARSLGLTAPIAIVPNGISGPEDPAILARHHRPDDTRELLYLGRLHPVKGVDDLLRGWAAFRRDGGAVSASWKLNVAGWGEPAYRTTLEALVAELGIADSVVFSGPKHGDDLWRAYAGADAYILPSHSEAMPMTILEAWISGVPVLMTRECGLASGLAAGAAMMTGRSAPEMGAAIAAMAALSDEKRQQMGAAGKALVARDHSWAGVAEAFAELSMWLGRGARKPDFVEL